MIKDVYELGETPPLGCIPRFMYASTLRQARYGPPQYAFDIEVVEVPTPGPNQVLVWVMAAGVNYNNVWAALGTPVDVIALRQRKSPSEPPFHIGGSDASGIVWAVGRDVKNVRIGDKVVLSCGVWDTSDDAMSGKDPMLSDSARIWGYEVNWGAFAQFALVQDFQCHAKPEHLSWEQSAAYMLVGATAYRQILGWTPNSLQEGDPVLIWGGAGGVGAMAIQIVKAKGGIPIAVVSSEERARFCMRLGAHGVIDRTDPAFTHWGRLPSLQDQNSFASWMIGASAFRQKWYETLGTRRGPRIVVEHPGQSTIPTSIFLCETGGMVVICAGTTGYHGDVDLRYLWMRQKRLQGSHFANLDECHAFNELVINKVVDPALSVVFSLHDAGLAHQMLHDNTHAPGNMAIRVNC